MYLQEEGWKRVEVAGIVALVITSGILVCIVLSVLLSLDCITHKWVMHESGIARVCMRCGVIEILGGADAETQKDMR